MPACIPPPPLFHNRIASFHLEEYEAAKEAFDAGASLAPDNSQFQTWARKCQAELEGKHMRTCYARGHGSPIVFMNSITHNLNVRGVWSDPVKPAAFPHLLVLCPSLLACACCANHAIKNTTSICHGMRPGHNHHCDVSFRP
eukprot:scaffold22360_cov17-Tisochrysis_lutea.AAC.3